jgi:ferrochelatase
MLAVAEHYYQFNGRSPINQQNRELIAALETELAGHGPNLPIYWGNRNWHPLLPDTLERMKKDGIRNALAFMTSAYSSYSGCRQYRENIFAAQKQVGEDAPEVHKLRAFYNHPGFIEPMIESVKSALERLPVNLRDRAEIVFTAHSIPIAMAQTSNYQRQLEETARLICEGLGRSSCALVFQSRSGPPSQPWLEPDILDFIRSVKQGGKASALVIAPIGFISDHMEIVYDLDTEARQLCSELNLAMERAATVGHHPRFIRMIRELIRERMGEKAMRLVLGDLGPSHDVCPDDCCPAPIRASGRP